MRRSRATCFRKIFKKFRVGSEQLFNDTIVFDADVCSQMTTVAAGSASFLKMHKSARVDVSFGIYCS